MRIEDEKSRQFYANECVKSNWSVRQLKRQIGTFYYERLLASQDIEAVIETSKIAKEKFRNVVELTMEMDKIIMDLSVKPENARKVLDVLYNGPIISRKKILEKIDIKPTTLNVTVNSLQERGIIQETTGYSRNQVFALQKYIDLFLK